MKILALAIILALQTTGLWSHIPDDTQDRLTRAAVNDQAVPIRSGTTGLASIAPLPVRVGTSSPELGAGSALALDADTGTVLYAKNPDERRPIASVTKLVTALVILSRHELNEPVPIAALPAYGSDEIRLGLIPGETYRVQELLQALLVGSANDAADALALFDADTIPAFTARMDAKMAEWGIPNTKFTSPSGIKDQDNYATATELGKIAGLALKSPFIRTTVGHTQITVVGSSNRPATLKTTNQLLAAGNFYGIKTGYTPAAGECFVGLTRINGREVITVVLGSTDRFGDSQRLANWIGTNWQWL